MFADDATLAKRCLAGDESAIQMLVERFQSDVFGLCVRLLRHRQDAEDVTQEVFLRVFRSLRRWDSQRSLRPWIMAIAVNRCRTWLARRPRRPELVEYLEESAASPEADDSAELHAGIQEALADLRVEYRTVFVLFHEQGRPYEDIAAVIRRPVGTVKTWLHRARLQLLNCLTQRGLVAPDPPSSTVDPTVRNAGRDP